MTEQDFINSSLEMYDSDECSKCGTELEEERFNDGGINEWVEYTCPKCRRL